MFASSSLRRWISVSVIPAMSLTLMTPVLLANANESEDVKDKSTVSADEAHASGNEHSMLFNAIRSTRLFVVTCVNGAMVRQNDDRSDRSTFSWEVEVSMKRFVE
jgi:hypothetical protein